MQVCNRTYQVYYNNTIQEAIELWSQNEGPLVARASHLAFIDLNNDTDPDAEIIFINYFTNDDNGNFILRYVSECFINFWVRINFVVRSPLVFKTIFQLQLEK